MALKQSMVQTAMQKTSAPIENSHSPRISSKPLTASKTSAAVVMAREKPKQNGAIHFWLPIQSF